MVVVASSKLRLNPGEAVIDPAVTGVAWVTKIIGGRTYEAMVKASQVGMKQDRLECFPHGHIPWVQEEPEIREININGWTTWKIPDRDFETLEWVREEQAQGYVGMTQERIAEITELTELTLGQPEGPAPRGE